MVRAILDGSKTQTRRVAKEFDGLRDLDKILARFPDQNGCRYGKAGDRLWVRETFADLQGTGIEHRQPPDYILLRYAYAADTRPGSAADEARKDYGIRWTPSIHMPRAASRISLEVTGVRVERLQAISEADARTEGAEGDSHPGTFVGTCRGNFARLWESINGAGSWDANPWVWVVEFKRVKP